jgi:hypothetical protein
MPPKVEDVDAGESEVEVKDGKMLGEKEKDLSIDIEEGGGEDPVLHQETIKSPSAFDPTNGITISLHGLTLDMEDSRAWFACCSRKQKVAKRTILRNITGVIWPGEMYALLGPSGAGKTSLLDVISGRKTTGKISGKVLFDGKVPTSLRLKRDTAYVQQQVSKPTPTRTIHSYSSALSHLISSDLVCLFVCLFWNKIGRPSLVIHCVRVHCLHCHVKAPQVDVLHRQEVQSN